LLAETFGGEPGFYHSVASGDPLPDSVIIWTRYTPVNETEVVTLEFRIAPVDPNLEPIEAHLDPAQNPALRRGTVTVHPESDWIAKIDVTGLTSGTSYVYAFTDGTRGSDVGLTKTAPGPNDDVTELRYAVFSCSNFPNGYFHAYDIASTIESLDLWIHTGDYFYEYGYAFRDPGPRIDPIMPIWEYVRRHMHSYVSTREAWFHTSLESTHSHLISISLSLSSELLISKITVCVTRRTYTATKDSGISANRPRSCRLGMTTKPQTIPT